MVGEVKLQLDEHVDPCSISKFNTPVYFSVPLCSSGIGILSDMGSLKKMVPNFVKKVKFRKVLIPFSFASSHYIYILVSKSS